MGWLAGWSNRKKITIDHTNIDADLTNFPLYVFINADADIGGKAQADGDDIRFTQNDGTTLLKYDVEYWNVAAGAATAHYWVKVPTVAGAANTDIYIYYGNAGAAAGADPVNTWDSYFKGVWHLNEASGVIYDSTANNHDSVTTNIASYQQAGKIDYCVAHDGITTYPVELADHADWDLLAGDAFTIELWADPDTVAREEFLWARYGSGINSGVYLDKDSGGYWAFEIISADTRYQVLSNAVASGGWQYIVGRRDGFGNMRIFVDGVEQTDTEVLATAVSEAAVQNIMVGSWGDNSMFDGLADEIRYSKGIARSNAWIKFVYYNVNEADHEISFAAQESAPPEANAIFFGTNF